MTCIIGVEYNNKIYLAGDTQGTGWNGKSLYTQSKVFEKQDAIFGYCGSFRWGQILETVLGDVNAPGKKDKTYNWLCQTLVPQLMKMCRDGHYGTPAGAKAGSTLIGVNGQLWELQSDWSVLRSVNKYNAVGSGEEYAKGAIGYALKNHPPKTEKELIKLMDEVIAMTGLHCPSVGTKADIIQN